jgi:hypothetical protein
VWATVVVIGCFLAYLALSVWLVSRQDGPDDSEGNGGGPGPPPDPPPDGPAWWPEFEREFAAHIAASEPKAKETKNARLP